MVLNEHQVPDAPINDEPTTVPPVVHSEIQPVVEMIPAAPAIDGDAIPDRVGSPSPPRPSRPTRSELEAMFHHIMMELKYTHGRAIKQNHDSVAKYAQRFYQSSRLCPDESQASLCLHYLAGLKLEMQQACAVDIHGQSWNNLDALVRFSYGEEIRLQARSSSCNSSYNSRSSRPSQGFQPVGRSGKVAAIKSDSQKRSRSAADEAGPSGLRSCPHHANNQAKKPRGPLEDCPLYGKEGRLSEADKSLLSEWAICWYCRKGTHMAKDCPLKKKKDEPK
ncbi:hypothetical protein CEUSTIGMA_g6278.t1 [Chlamydomonas eustigma]|uniref:CCHC-type domain-containing protein n=1 Tax=Chlamydomonas eustigma TaxID=1157962 RepID=A0A250X7U9_9CHLO|nr:hypothetical protein CEUSTIGMA_g6278.t1 [Chlamydomonas eustigma]|eukprot:GAX78840.1 hypothetical protein CEUSTIGMA_g6278.t1 [Chlamydomonas eustigma]